ncbi:MAG: cation:proton antiporter [Actinomycetota bacterium]
MSEDEVIIALGTIIVFGVGAQWIGRRVGIPSILILLPAGLLAGDVFDLVNPTDLFGDLLFPLVALLLGLLLFQAGLQLRIHDLPTHARRSVARLVSVGALITFIGASFTVWLLFDVSVGLAVMVGSILIVSGPTVVGPLLAVVRPVAPNGSILNWESTVLDPIGATVGIVVLNLLLAVDRPGVHPLLQLLERLGLGIGVGLVMGLVLVLVMSRFLLTDDMEASVALLFAVLAFTVAEVMLSEAGFFATVTVGIFAANQGLVATQRIAGVGETLDVLIIGTLFIVLGALVQIDDLIDYALPTAGLVAVLVLIVRPLSVGIGLAGLSLPWRDRALIGWVDPRGVVAAATAAQFSGRLGNSGYDTEFMLPVVFGVIIGTGVIYGITTPFVARWLRVARPSPTGVGLLGNDPWLDDFAAALARAGARVLLVTTRPPPPDELVSGATTVAVAPLHPTTPGPFYPRSTDLPIETATDPESHGSITTLSLHAPLQEVEEAVEEAAVADLVVSFRRGAVNALVVSTFIEILGRRQVLLLPNGTTNAPRRLIPSPGERITRIIPSPLRITNRPFRGALTRTAINERLSSGWQIQAVDQSPPVDSIVLAAVDEDGRVDLQRPQASEHQRSHHRRSSRDESTSFVVLAPGAAPAS